jgi:copper chaperone CopZ
VATLSVIELRPVDLCCISCADRVLAAVRAVPGVSHVSLDDQSGRLTVDLDAQARFRDSGARGDQQRWLPHRPGRHHSFDRTAGSHDRHDPGHLLHSL